MTMELKVMYCPVPDCDYEAKYIGHMKWHFKLHHQDAWERCPLCGVDLKFMKHPFAHYERVYRHYKDVQHLVLYVLTSPQTVAYRSARNKALRYRVYKLLMEGFEFDRWNGFEVREI